MFIAHLPAGYLLTLKLQAWFKTKKYLWLGLVASVLPDIDIFYFLLFDGRRTFHHLYLTHLPFYWAVLALAVYLALLLTKQKKLIPAATVFFANIFLHLILDTIVGGILWLYPFSNLSYHLITVPAKYSFWVYSFVFHWTFLLELGITAGALGLFLKKKGARDKTYNQVLADSNSYNL
jgi:inner membrane protein